MNTNATFDALARNAAAAHPDRVCVGIQQIPAMRNSNTGAVIQDAVWKVCSVNAPHDETIRWVNRPINDRGDTLPSIVLDIDRANHPRISTGDIFTVEEMHDLELHGTVVAASPASILEAI